MSWLRRLARWLEHRDRRLAEHYRHAQDALRR